MYNDLQKHVSFAVYKHWCNGFVYNDLQKNALFAIDKKTTQSSSCRWAKEGAKHAHMYDVTHVVYILHDDMPRQRVAEKAVISDREQLVTRQCQTSLIVTEFGAHAARNSFV